MGDEVNESVITPEQHDTSNSDPSSSGSNITSANTSSINELTPELVVNFIKSCTDKVDLLFILESTRAALGVCESNDTDEDDDKNSPPNISSQPNRAKRRKTEAKSQALISEQLSSNIPQPLVEDNAAKSADDQSHDQLQSNPSTSQLTNQTVTQTTSTVLQNKNTKSTANSKQIKNNPKSNSPRDPTKPPDIVLRPQQNWVAFRDSLIAHNIKIKSAKYTDNGVKISTPSFDDYHNTIKLMKAESKAFYTFMPEAERDLHVVVRGPALELSIEEAREDLVAKGFSPTKIVVMKHPRTKQNMPLFLVCLPRNDSKSKDIYNIRDIQGIICTVQPLNQSPQIGQCYRCLTFGHSSQLCTADYRCKNCAGPHDSAKCKAPPGAPSKCCNCGGNHKASYRGCPRAPQSRPVYPDTAPSAAPSNTYPTKSTTSFPPLKGQNLQQNLQQKSNVRQFQSQSMAQAVKKGQNSNTTPAAALSQQDMQASMLQFQQALGTLAGMFTSMAQVFNISNVRTNYD